MRQTFSKGVVVGAVVSVVVLAASSAFAGTGIGGVFNLGKTNSVNATTTLQGSSSKTLQLKNSGSGAALGLNVATDQPPLTTNSKAEVHNLNSALVDGQSTSDFQQASDDVRLDAALSVGATTQSFSVGPLLTLSFSCTQSLDSISGTLTLLNNAPPPEGSWSDTQFAEGEQPGPDVIQSGAINSGDSGVLTDTVGGTSFDAENFITLVWQDPDETVSATYDINIYAAGTCVLAGTALRTT